MTHTHRCNKLANDIADKIKSSKVIHTNHNKTGVITKSRNGLLRFKLLLFYCFNERSRPFHY